MPLFPHLCSRPKNSLMNLLKFSPVSRKKFDVMISGLVSKVCQNQPVGDYSIIFKEALLHLQNSTGKGVEIYLGGQEKCLIGGMILADTINAIGVQTNFTPKWFHGHLSRYVAESLLKQDGDFLVRVSNTRRNTLVLSVVAEGRVQHVLLDVDTKGQICTYSGTFSNVSQFIHCHLNGTSGIVTPKGNVFFLERLLINTNNIQNIVNSPTLTPITSTSNSY